MMLEENAIITALATNDPAYKPKRAQRIGEALAFAGGRSSAAQAVTENVGVTTGQES